MAVPSTSAVPLAESAAAATTESDRSRSPRSGATSPSSAGAEARAAIPAPRLAATETAPAVLSYAQTTSDKWYVKTVGKNAMGSPTICIYDSATKAPPAFCLYANEECGTVVFPLEPRK